ncbi:U7 snRNA-associated Sm-like protein LSm11 [Phlebotomus argentipes]|uniref:U7 snRNA-associated Sm-like protein LSm11 n=1 Tax=Phlebotomus argentipes TaxID=94469 RepID=UPI002892F7A2|nr:U7 snRNA-associated Sm-like protein LSm11 [Phlebotomus argentipes]
MSESEDARNGGNDEDEITRKTDPESEHFDPIFALYAEKIPYIDSTVPKFDNLAIFEGKLKAAGSLEVDLSMQERKDKPSTAASASTSTAGNIRRFLPEQEMVKGYKRAKHTKNVLNITQNFKGPLKQLHEFMEEKQRVKIYIRHNHGIRGYVTGVIEMFDKHWNIVLTDVEEFYKRRKYNYTGKGGVFDNPGEDCSERLKELGIALPEVTVKSINRKNVECRRRIPNILLRGEQIALVTRHIDPS